MLDGIVVEQVGRGLADALPEAGGGGLQPLGLHFGGDPFGLLQRGLRLSMANTAFKADAAHAACLWLTLDRTLRMKWTMHRWVARVRQHRVHGGDCICLMVCVPFIAGLLAVLPGEKLTM